METIDIILSCIFLPILLFLSALFSGLNLGMLSLDLVGLEVVINSGEGNDPEYAKKIIPIRQKGNLLLCTILLGNVLVNSIIAIFLADITSGVIGTVITTIAIVIFGEIIPQAYCSRNGLAVGYYARYILYFFMSILYIAAKPISMVLDHVLEHEIGSVYNRAQLMELLKIHEDKKYGDLKKDELSMMGGALKMSQKIVIDIMTPWDRVYMLNIDQHLNFKTLCNIVSFGHSRIPIYGSSKNEIFRILIAKTLIHINPEDQIPIRTLLNEATSSQPLIVSPSLTLDYMLNEFQKGKTHMALIQDEQINPVTQENLKVFIGIVTLEDVLEFLIQEPIQDETDQMDQMINPLFMPQSKFKSPRYSDNELETIISYLSGKFPQFGPDIISNNSLKKLVLRCPPLDLVPPKYGPGLLLYERGVHEDTCCLVLSDGPIEIIATDQNFKSEAGPFKLLAVDSLTQSNYTSDFSAHITKPVRIMKISRALYNEHLLHPIIYNTAATIFNFSYPSKNFTSENLKVNEISVDISDQKEE